MNALKIAKFGLGTIASLGTGTVIRNAIQATTPADLNTYNKIMVSVGGFVVSGMVAAAATGYVEKSIDDIVEGVKKTTTRGEEN